VQHQQFYRVLKRTIERLMQTLPDFELGPALRSRDEDTLGPIMAGFAARTDGLLRGVVGAIDGLLIPIKRPGKSAGNERVYRCRKGFFAYNVQAIADVRGRFLHAQVARCPGAAHDSYAWTCSRLCHEMRGDTPMAAWMRRTGKYLIGDDAYSASHTLVVPWPGKHRRDSPEP